MGFNKHSSTEGKRCEGFGLAQARHDIRPGRGT
jgi:hypothetical protein